MSVVNTDKITVVVSERDKAIVLLLTEGCRVPEIAKRLTLNERTLEAHMDKMRRIYDCKTREQLVAFFIRNKIIE